METQAICQQTSSGVTAEEKSCSPGKAYCRTSAGWSCTITRTVGPDAGKVFAECGGDCTCVVDADGTVSRDDKLPKELEDAPEGVPFCRCGEGWGCVISKVEGPDTAKPFYDCTGSCVCVTPEA